MAVVVVVGVGIAVVVVVAAVITIVIIAVVVVILCRGFQSYLHSAVYFVYKLINLIPLKYK